MKEHGGAPHFPLSPWPDTWQSKSIDNKVKIIYTTIVIDLTYGQKHIYNLQIQKISNRLEKWKIAAVVFACV